LPRGLRHDHIIRRTDRAIAVRRIRPCARLLLLGAILLPQDRY
jgi:hypothetical protein